MAIISGDSLSIDIVKLKQDLEQSGVLKVLSINPTATGFECEIINAENFSTTLTAEELQLAESIISTHQDQQKRKLQVKEPATEVYDATNKLFVDNKINDIIGPNANAALDTLMELSTALNNDSNFATTIATQINQIESDITSLENDVESLQQADQLLASNIQQGDQTVLTTLSSQLSTEQTTRASADNNLQNQITSLSSSLKPVATSGSYTDLSNKPTLFGGSYNDLSDLPILFSGAYADLSGKPNLATVATSGSYTDLLYTPFIPASLTDLTDVTITTEEKGQFLVHNGTNFVNSNIIEANTSTTKPLIIKAASSQTANLLEVQSSNGAIIAGVNASGNLISPTITDLTNRIQTLETAPVTTTLDDLTDVTLTTLSTGQILKYDGSKWINGAAPITGVTTINGLTTQSQTFDVGSSGADFNISSSSSTHIFNIPDASSSARGLINTTAQIISGVKTFSQTIVGAITGNAGTADKLKTARTISLSGDGTASVSFDGSSDVFGTLTLSNTGVVADTYTKVSVNSSGRITSGTFLQSSDIPTLDASKITTGQLSILRGGTGATTAQGAIDALTQVSSATNEHVLTKDSATGNARWKAITSTTFALPDGNAGSPALYFTNDTNTGFYRQSADKLTFVANGQNSLVVDGTSGVGRLMVGNGTPVSRIQLADDSNNAASGITLGTGAVAAQLYKSANNTVNISSKLKVSGAGSGSTVIEANYTDFAGVHVLLPGYTAIGSSGTEFPSISYNAMPTTSNTIFTKLGIDTSWRINLGNSNKFTVGFSSSGSVAGTNFSFTELMSVNSSGQGVFASSVTATSFVNSSDYRLKENITSMSESLSKIQLLIPRTWTWKNTQTSGQGFIAHELAEVVPNAVVGEKDAVDSEGNPIYQGVDYGALIPILTSSIKELNEKVISQEQRIQQLEEQIAILLDNKS